MDYKKWLDKNTTRLDGKTIGITGSTGGLGKEICLFLGYLGANLVLINRNIKKSEEQKKDLLSKYQINVSIVKCDMEDIKSIYEAVDILKDIHMDYFILNAGAYKVKRYVTDLGVDNLFQINNVSPYLLINNLSNINHVVMVGSIAYGLAKFDVNNYDYKNRSDMKTYGNSKRWLMYSLIHKCQNENINLSIGHPGITPTDITRNYPKWLKSLIKYPMKLLFISPKKASLCIIKSMFNPSYSYWYGPKIFNIWGRPSKKKIKYRVEDASKMIIINESLCKKH